MCSTISCRVPTSNGCKGSLPDHVAAKAFPRLDTLVDVEARLRLVEEFDGLQQVLSLANPPLELLGPPAVSVELARDRERLPGGDLPPSSPGHFRPSSPRCR